VVIEYLSYAFIELGWFYYIAFIGFIISAILAGYLVLIVEPILKWKKRRGIKG